MTFKKGQSGNPLGRPVGSRNKLELEFLDACYANWKEHGPESLEIMRQTDVTSYCKMIASILPKHSEKTIKHDVANLSDAELISLVRDTRDQLRGPAGPGSAGNKAESKDRLN